MDCSWTSAHCFGDELWSAHPRVTPGKVFQHIWKVWPGHLQLLKALYVVLMCSQNGDAVLWREKSQKLKDCFYEMPVENLSISMTTLGPRKQLQLKKKGGERHMLPISLAEHCGRRVWEHCREPTKVQCGPPEKWQSPAGAIINSRVQTPLLKCLWLGIPWTRLRRRAHSGPPAPAVAAWSLWVCWTLYTERSHLTPWLFGNYNFKQTTYKEATFTTD